MPLLLDAGPDDGGWLVAEMKTPVIKEMEAIDGHGCFVIAGTYWMA